MISDSIAKVEMFVQRLRPSKLYLNTHHVKGIVQKIYKYYMKCLKGKT